ncbi:hypothetical protein MMC20_001462 [Loxospora ochrophaea]|nr:hypothetical protein [Loxospora ochrophaea]
MQRNSSLGDSHPTRPTASHQPYDFLTISDEDRNYRGDSSEIVMAVFLTGSLVDFEVLTGLLHSTRPYWRHLNFLFQHLRLLRLYNHQPCRIRGLDDVVLLPTPAGECDVHTMALFGITRGELAVLDDHMWDHDRAAAHFDYIDEDRNVIPRLDDDGNINTSRRYAYVYHYRDAESTMLEHL